MAPASEGKRGTTLLVIQVELPAFNLLSQANFTVKANRYEEMHEGAVELLQAFADSFPDCLVDMEAKQTHSGLAQLKKGALAALEELQTQVKLVDEWKAKVEKASNQVNKMRDAYYKELFHLREQVYQKKKADEKGSTFVPNYAIHFDPAEYVVEDEVSKLVNEKAEFIKQEYETKFAEHDLRCSAKIETLNNHLITSNMLLKRKETLLQKMMVQQGYEDEEHIQEELGAVKINKEKLQNQIDKAVSKAEQKVTYDFRKKQATKDQKPAENQNANAKEVIDFLERRFGTIKEAKAHLAQSRSLDERMGLTELRALFDELGYECADAKQTFKELTGGRPFATLAEMLEYRAPRAKTEDAGTGLGNPRRCSAPSKLGGMVAISEADEWDAPVKAPKTDDEDNRSVASESVASNSSMGSASSKDSKASSKLSSKASKAGRSSIAKVANTVKSAASKFRATAAAAPARAGVRKATVGTMTELAVDAGTKEAWADQPGSVGCFIRMRPVDSFQDAGTDARPYEEVFQSKPRRTRAVQSQIDGRMLDKAMDFFDHVAENNWNELAGLMTYGSESSEAQKPRAEEGSQTPTNRLEAYMRTGKLFDLSSNDRLKLGHARPNETMTIGDFSNIDQILPQLPAETSQRTLTFPVAAKPQDKRKLERLVEKLQGMSPEETTQHFMAEPLEVGTTMGGPQLQVGQEQAGGSRSSSSSSSSSGRSTRTPRQPSASGQQGPGGHCSRRERRDRSQCSRGTSPKSPASTASRATSRARSRSQSRVLPCITTECGVQCCLSTLGAVSIPAEDEAPEAQLEGLQHMLDAAQELRERLPAMRLRAERLAAEAQPGSEREQKLLEELRKLNASLDGRPVLRPSRVLQAEAENLPGVGHHDTGMTLEGLLSRHCMGGETPRKDDPPARDFKDANDRHNFMERRQSLGGHHGGEAITRKETRHKTHFYRRPGEIRQFHAGLVRSPTLHGRDAASPAEPEEDEVAHHVSLRRKSAITARKTSVVDTAKIITERARRSCEDTVEVQEAKTANEEEEDAEREGLSPGWSGLVPPAAFTHLGVQAEVEAAADSTNDRSRNGLSSAAGEREPLVKRKDTKLHTTSLCFVGSARAVIASAAAAAAAAVDSDSDDSDPQSPPLQVAKSKSERRHSTPVVPPAPLVTQAFDRDAGIPRRQPEAVPHVAQRSKRRLGSVRFKTNESSNGQSNTDEFDHAASGDTDTAMKRTASTHTGGGVDRHAELNMMRISSMGSAKKPGALSSVPRSDSPQRTDSFLDMELATEDGMKESPSSGGCQVALRDLPAQPMSSAADAHLPELLGSATLTSADRAACSASLTSTRSTTATEPWQVERPMSRSLAASPTGGSRCDQSLPVSVLPRGGGSSSKCDRGGRRASLTLPSSSSASPASPRKTELGSARNPSPVPMQVAAEKVAGAVAQARAQVAGRPSLGTCQAAAEKVAGVIAQARAEVAGRPAQGTTQEEQLPVASPTFRRKPVRTVTQPVAGSRRSAVSPAPAECLGEGEVEVTPQPSVAVGHRASLGTRPLVGSGLRSPR